jgi:hypothetical protein
MAVFGSGLDLRKWIGIVADLIDVGKKKSKNILYRKAKFFVL